MTSSKIMTLPEKILILIAATLLYSCVSTQKKIDCSVFKKGIFELHSKFDNSIYIIERNDSIQTETNTKTWHVVKARIKWTGECEYELNYFQQTTNTADTIIPFIQTGTLKTQIFKTTKNYYVFRSTMDGIDKTLTDTLRVIK
jgi:hypothetical protein